MRVVFLALLACLGATSARADGEVLSKMTAADKAKLAGFDATRAKAIAEARAGGSPIDLAELDKALSGTPKPVHDFDFKGNWRCRVLKLGKGLPIVVYPWFSCRAFEDDYSLRLEKTGGSQRTSGYFYDDDDPKRMIYLGALHYGGDARMLYGKDRARDQVAYGYWLSKNRFRLEFPQPEYESLMDVMEFERK
ncbi:MAG: DUF4893 domain-containing protein [Beijerinckiaceae bacterium]